MDVAMSNEDKSAWCREGEAFEHKFIDRYGKLLRLSINPEKEHDKFAPDLVHDYGGLCDLKTQSTPFRMAGKLYGVPSEHCVTFNRKDAVRYYHKYPDVYLYFWVRFMQSPTIFSIGFDELVDKLKDAPEHFYKSRDGDGLYDDNGNALSSFLLDTRELIFLLDTKELI